MFLVVCQDAAVVYYNIPCEYFGKLCAIKS